MVLGVKCRSAVAVSSFLCACVLLLSACSLREPDHFTDKKVRVEQEKIERTMGAADMDDATLSALAAHYRRHGEGPLKLVVTYDPYSPSHTAMKAGDKAADIASRLRAEGVPSVEANILPVMNSGEEARIMVSYIGYNALGPEGCTPMPGIESRKVNANESYQMGCSLDMIFARQIARPKDLMGQKNAAGSDARRSSVQIEEYRSGTDLGELGGETASGD